MNSDRARINRLRLLVGILGGLIVGTVHALVSHTMLRVDPIAPAALEGAGRAGFVVLDPAGSLLLPVVDNGQQAASVVPRGRGPGRQAGRR